MKKIFYFFASGLLLCNTSCSDNDDDDKIDDYKTYDITIQLIYPEGSDFEPVQDVEVRLSNTSGSAYDAKTNASGTATFTVPAGVYEASVTDVRFGTGESFIFSGINSYITVSETMTDYQFTVTLTESKKGQVVIKELYIGGCQKDDGSGVFQWDKYAIIYNNSDLPVSLENLCLGMALPYNANAANNDYVDGKLYYEAEGWIPAGNGIWYLPNNVTLAPGEQMVIALCGAIDHTETYTQSINFSNPDYYCTYDISAYENATSYPSPAEVISTSHYFSAVKYGPGNAWSLSTSCPAFFIFATKDVSPVDFANDADRTNYHGGNVAAAQIRKKVPVEWVIDAVEVFTTTSEKNSKRLTADVDAGQIYLENKIGYTSYRNVDLEATKAIEDNEAKLVYSYNKGTELNGKESTDPSGVDAEASIKNGARIIYKDTNNSTNDFHQRSQASLRD